MEAKHSSRKNPHTPILRPRVETARPMLKSKTTAEILRPASGRPKEFYTLSRLIPNIIKEDKELLFEENMRLKALSNEILEENLHLKTQVKHLQSRKKKIDNKDPTMSLVSTLKEKIKELNQKVSEKEEEAQVLRRNLKTCKLEETEIAQQALEDECKRLSNHLAEFMKIKEIPNSHMEYENRLYNKGKVISKLKKELTTAQDGLFQAKEEIASLKDRLHNLERKNKKTSPRSHELSNLKDEIEILKTQNARVASDLHTKEEDFRSEVKSLKEIIEKDNIRYKNLEKDYEERQLRINMLEKQMDYLKSQNYQIQEALLPKALIPNEEKSKHPPRLFVKIWELARQKKMLISVYLSLLDKNNNGTIEAEELRRGVNFHGKLIKKKHVDEILRLMNNPTNTISLSVLEQLLEKYEFDEEYVSSSEEEVIEPVKPRAERLKFKVANPDPKMNDPIIPQNYPAPAKFKEVEIVLVRPEELKNVFERIRLQMIEKMISKDRCINVLFGNYLDPEQLVSVSEVAEYLHSGGIFFGGEEDVQKFAKFLIEPEGIPILKESDYKKIKNKQNEFSKKVIKALPNWNVFDRFKQHLVVHQLLIENRAHIFEEAKKNGTVSPYLVSLEDFQKILEHFGNFDVNFWTHLYLLSFKNTKEVFQVSLVGMYEELEAMQMRIAELGYKHQRILRNVLSGFEKYRTSFEAVFLYDKEILANVESFTAALKSIDVAADEGFVNDIKFGKYSCHLGLMKALLVNQE